MSWPISSAVSPGEQLAYGFQAVADSLNKLSGPRRGPGPRGRDGPGAGVRYLDAAAGILRTLRRLGG